MSRFEARRIAGAGAAVAVAAARLGDAEGGGRARPPASGCATPRRSLDTPIYVDHRLPSHDGGSIYVVEAGEGPPIVLSHGVTLSVRTWFHQLELLPKEGFRTIAFDHRGHGRVGAR